MERADAGETAEEAVGAGEACSRRDFGIRNLTEGKYIELYADGHINSLDSISSELMDSLHKAHDMYWKQG